VKGDKDVVLNEVDMLKALISIPVFPNMWNTVSSRWCRAKSMIHKCIARRSTTACTVSIAHTFVSS
jgi:hypothetical protein